MREQEGKVRTAPRASRDRRRITALLIVAGALLAPSVIHAEEGRFDAQVFRPSAAPRDLVMVRKSEVIGHLSPTVGLFSDLGFDPLVLVNKSTDQAINAVAARLTLTPMAGIGFFDWFDMTVAVPLVAWQYGGNLRSIGTEGPVKSTTLGDIHLSTKVSLPYFNRRGDVRKGFGLALAGDVNLPTGNPKDFTGDGVVTGGPSIIADYRFGFGAVLSANLGVWLRPDRQFAGVRVGDMASFGLGAEVYVIKPWGLSVIGEVYGYPSLTKFPDSPAQIPAEFLLGGRWQGKHGISITLGGSFGAACSFGAPAFRLWSSITFQPEKSREQVNIDRIKEGKEADPDHDGVIDDADFCPDTAGPAELHGCPDRDKDEDGIPDYKDPCPSLAGEPGGQLGCPAVYMRGKRIEMAEEVRFLDNSDTILDESKAILDRLAEVLIEHEEILRVRIEGRTDVREADAHSVVLSQERVESVRRYLIDQWKIDPGRLVAKGYGHLRPLVDDSGCTGAEAQLTQACQSAMAKNRGVRIRLLRVGTPPSRAIAGTTKVGKAAVLPPVAAVWVLPWQGALPRKKRVLEKNTLLPRRWLLPDNRLGTLPWQVLPSRSTVTAEDPAPEDKADDELLEEVWAKDDPHAIHPGLIILAK